MHGKESNAGKKILASIILRAESSPYFEVTLCILCALNGHLNIFLVISTES
jgi:hypothetical protein